MSIKIKKGEFYGDADELVKFFEKTNVDVPSLFNAPRTYKIHSALIWLSIILYFICLIVGYFSAGDCKFIMNLICLASMAVCGLLCYMKFKKTSIAIFIVISGLIIYLFSTRGITNEDLRDYTNRSINKYLPVDSISK